MPDGVILAAMLGAATGIRSTAGLATLAVGPPFPGSPGRGMRSDLVRRVLEVAFVAEVVADKLVPLPSRTDAVPLAGRALLGAAAAAAGARWIGGSRLGAAVVGSTMAVGAAWLATAGRTAARARGIVDALPALAEDATVIALGAATVAGARKRLYFMRSACSSSVPSARATSRS